MYLLLPLLIVAAAAGPLSDRSIHPVEERQLPSGDPCGRLVGTNPGEFLVFKISHAAMTEMSQLTYMKDPVNQADDVVYTPRTILACVQSIAFKPEARSNIMGVADVVYGQLDVLAANQLGDSEPSINQGINLQNECEYLPSILGKQEVKLISVSRINSSTYDSDYAFQFDLSRVLTTLNDGHAAWSSCYASLFRTSHAIPLVALADSAESTSTNIYIVPDVQNFVSDAGFGTIYSQAGINVASLAGAQVLGIEGKSGEL